jgi:hypothetical protein
LRLVDKKNRIIFDLLDVLGGESPQLRRVYRLWHLPFARQAFSSRFWSREAIRPSTSPQESGKGFFDGLAPCGYFASLFRAFQAEADRFAKAPSKNAPTLSVMRVASGVSLCIDA